MLSTNLSRRPGNALVFGSRDPFFDLANRFFSSWPTQERDTENGTSASWAPAVDIRETETEFVAMVELPGLSKDDIDVSLEDNVLSISGQRKMEKVSENDTYHRLERSYGAFQRAFSLPKGVDTTKVNAKFKDGLLSLTLPKSEEVKPRKISVS